MDTDCHIPAVSRHLTTCGWRGRAVIWTQTAIYRQSADISPSVDGGEGLSDGHRLSYVGCQQTSHHLNTAGEGTDTDCHMSFPLQTAVTQNNHGCKEKIARLGTRIGRQKQRRRNARHGNSP